MRHGDSKSILHSHVQITSVKEVMKLHTKTLCAKIHIGQMICLEGLKKLCNKSGSITIQHDYFN